MIDVGRLEKLALAVRYRILSMTTKAGSGHPTSSLSATDLMVALFFNKLRFDLQNPQNSNNDRVIFSKGHVSPLIYALYATCGVLSDDELSTYRKFNSRLEGHPTFRFPYTEVATGSLGQGLSIGVGMALAIQSDFAGPVSSFSPASPSTAATRKNLPMVYVLMGDGETAEGSVWEALELASHYQLSNLVGFIDVNRLGQSGETMLSWDMDTYQKRIAAFGWETVVVDGHNLAAIGDAFSKVAKKDKPTMIIAKTVKGKGVSFLEDKENWHGKALSHDDFEKAVKELGEIDKNLKGEISKPEASNIKKQISKIKYSNQRLNIQYKIGEEVATRKAYGETIAKLGDVNEDIVVLDAEVKNSTFAEIFKDKHPERFFEMYIAEQNMVGAALGFSKRGKIPFVSTFSAFFTRAYDQIRMSAYSHGNIKFVGSHSGVSIGEDGPSQMGLEDIAMFRSVYDSVVLCPSDAVSCAKLTEAALAHEGIVYIRTARPATKVIYSEDDTFSVGGSKVIRTSANDKLTIVACGVALMEALSAAEELTKDNIQVRVVDAYSIKPIDEKTLKKCAQETNNTIITVEDHYFDGGLGDAVLNVFAEDQVKIYKLAVSKMPMSGKPQELLDYEEISAHAIAQKVRELTS